MQAAKRASLRGNSFASVKTIIATTWRCMRFENLRLQDIIYPGGVLDQAGKLIAFRSRTRRSTVQTGRDRIEIVFDFIG
jgi:hypothetical protein